LRRRLSDKEASAIKQKEGTMIRTMTTMTNVESG
jgi:hypothetical protein